MHGSSIVPEKRGCKRRKKTRPPSRNPTLLIGREVKEDFGGRILCLELLGGGVDCLLGRHARRHPAALLEGDDPELGGRIGRLGIGEQGGGVAVGRMGGGGGGGVQGGGEGWENARIRVSQRVVEKKD